MNCVNCGHQPKNCECERIDGREELPTAFEFSVLKCDECGKIVNPELYGEYQEKKESNCGKCNFGKLKPHSVEAVRREDAEQAREQARQDERQRILDLIDQRIEKLEGWKKQKEKKAAEETSNHYGKVVAAKSYDPKIKELAEMRQEIKEENPDHETAQGGNAMMTRKNQDTEHEDSPSSQPSQTGATSNLHSAKERRGEER